MRVLVVDDEAIALKKMEYLLSQYDSTIAVDTALHSRDAAALAQEKHYDIAFLDIDMPIQNGIELAKVLRETDPKINIVFVTAYREYGYDAFGANASAYLLKPISLDDLKSAFLQLRMPVDKKPIYVQCFGNFEVFYDGHPIYFSRQKTKELFAYLIDRKGAAVTTGQMCEIFEKNETQSETNKSYIRMLIADIRETFNKYDCCDILISRRNSYAINTDAFDCDYYNFLKEHGGSYKGEYMHQYSWAEFTHGSLEN